MLQFVGLITNLVKRKTMKLILNDIRMKRHAVLVNKGKNKMTEQSNKGKVKTLKCINRQNQSTTGKL